MIVSQAIEGYLLDRQAGGYADTTIRLYRMYLGIFCQFLADPPLDQITLQDLQRYMLYLKTSYQPRKMTGKAAPGTLSSAAIDNHWKAVRSFFSWCNITLGTVRPDIHLARPPTEKPEITSLSENDIKRLVIACERTTEARTDGRKTFSMKRPTADRDKALLFLFLDTGLRVGEVCRLCVDDVNLETGEILVVPHGSGQKTKSRVVFLGRAAKKALWLYLAKRKDHIPQDRLFELDAESIRSLFRRLGERAGVHKLHPHKLRHHFALSYLRNGGDVYSLKYLLGHASLDMVERYLNLTTADAGNAHRRASPVDNLKL